MSVTNVPGELSRNFSIDEPIVTPVVGYLGDIDISKLTGNASELDEIFTLSLDQLTDPTKIKFTNYGVRGTLPTFFAGVHPVWGLTAYILHGFLKDILKLKLPNVPEMDPQIPK